jgi:hypothetical protein
MVTFASYFWPTIWAMIGIGTVVTAALCLAIATVPSPRSRMPHGLARGSRQHHGPRLIRHAHAA